MDKNNAGISFLKKYEQDQCEYCHGIREISLYNIHNSNKELLTLFGVIYKNNLIIERIGETASGVCKIGFCPMCGRRLRND